MQCEVSKRKKETKARKGKKKRRKEKKDERKKERQKKEERRKKKEKKADLVLDKIAVKAICYNDGCYH